jgi:antitoxin component of RelBE/YafQ-DinJ toxin-antitoxin module
MYVMSNVLLSIKTDEQTKQELKTFAAELGVSSTAFVNMVVKQALRDRRVVLSTDLEPTPYLEQLIGAADADYAADRNITHTKGSKEALAHLDSLMQK